MMKYILLFGSLNILLLVAMFMYLHNANDYHRSDINRDGKVDIQDVSIFLYDVQQIENQ